ncbi:hypothetical protein RF11_13736 [Thelohanellus kitauei]|uniref:Uncharacterized protein n=1 Tax=Thelohanellus kitauei TaxID=669202 RepID=A0A0C2IF29_THEKT|nr:hypothetical protein RF11_13736 [Thelohanellus kitauei]
MNQNGLFISTLLVQMVSISIQQGRLPELTYNMRGRYRVSSFHDTIIQTISNYLNHTIKFKHIFEWNLRNILLSVSKNHPLAEHQYFEVYCYTAHICELGSYLAYFATGIIFD